MILLLKDDDIICDILNDCGYKAVNYREFTNNILSLLIDKKIDNIKVKYENDKIHLSGLFENMKFKVVLSNISYIDIIVNRISVSVVLNENISKKLVRVYGKNNIE